MDKSKINQYLKENQNLSRGELCNKTGLSWDAVYHRQKRLGILITPDKTEEKPPVERVHEDVQKLKTQKEFRVLKENYQYVLEELEKANEKVRVLAALGEKPNTFSIPKHVSGKGGAVAVVLASDWHIEESVKPETVSGMNFYNLEESKRRATQFFSVLLYLVELEQKNTKIDHLVLALLGDFISGDIHPDIGKSVLLESSHAVVRCQDYIISGIEYLLANSSLKITIVCHSGNHGRKDKEQMIANEAGNSIEYLLYQMLKNYFRSESRVQFIISEGYHSYMDIHGTTIRFHHGHNIRYGGGVGGVTIPVNKAIAQWNKTKDARTAPFYEQIKQTIQDHNLARPADLDCFGHFHQFLDGGNFICNGSMIGYNAYAISIKASYEPPSQTLFFVYSNPAIQRYTRRISFPFKK